MSFSESEARLYVDTILMLCGAGTEAVKRFTDLGKTDTILTERVFEYMERVVDAAPVLSPRPGTTLQYGQNMLVDVEGDATTYYTFTVDSGGWYEDKAVRKVYTYNGGAAMSVRKGAYLVQLTIHLGAHNSIP